MSEHKNRVVLIGWPIAHSLSPGMLNAVFAEARLDWVYSLLPTKPEALTSSLDQFDALNVVGGNVTMPHKQTIMPYLADISDEARIIGAVNTFKVEDGRIYGYNTDGIGFLNALKAEGYDPSGMRVVVLGAGGGARAAIFALAQARVDRITIINRTEQRGMQLTGQMAAAFPDCVFRFKPLTPTTLAEVSADHVDLLVNATSVGMEPDTDQSLWPGNLTYPEGAVCYDLIYRPIKTRFRQRAEAQGHHTLNGLGMLVHHAVVAFKIWTGQDASLASMEKACLNALSEETI